MVAKLGAKDFEVCQRVGGGELAGHAGAEIGDGGFAGGHLVEHGGVGGDEAVAGDFRAADHAFQEECIGGMSRQKFKCGYWRMVVGHHLAKDRDKLCRLGGALEGREIWEIPGHGVRIVADGRGMTNNALCGFRAWQGYGSIPQRCWRVAGRWSLIWRH